MKINSQQYFEMAKRNMKSSPFKRARVRLPTKEQGQARLMVSAKPEDASVIASLDFCAQVNCYSEVKITGIF